MTLEKAKSALPARQQGVAILAITIILLLVATIATLMVGRIGLFEQKIVGTDVRSKEVYAAATGGLEAGVKWFEDNFSDLAFEDIGSVVVLDEADLPPTAEMNADDYGVAISYELRSYNEADVDAGPTIVRVIATATAENDSHISKTVSVDVMIGKVPGLFGNSPMVSDDDPAVFQGPPVMVEGCMSGVTGNPDIYPHEDLGIAIGTTQGTVGCIDEGHFDLHGGTKQALSPQMSIAKAVFGVDIPEGDPDLKYVKDEDAVKAKLLKEEAKYPDRVYVVDAGYPRYEGQPTWNGNNWHNSLGSEDAPVILYFDRAMGCPKVNGGPVVHGLVYFAANDCASHGWGGGEIHGTVAFRGDMVKHTANANIYGKSIDFGGGGDDEGDDDETITIDEGDFPGAPVNKFAEIPGSWRDF